ncbi:MAG: hypothetical protein ACKOXM_01850 [Agromyces sp.]
MSTTVAALTVPLTLSGCAVLPEPQPQSDIAEAGTFGTAEAAELAARSVVQGWSDAVMGGNAAFPELTGIELRRYATPAFLDELTPSLNSLPTLAPGSARTQEWRSMRFVSTSGQSFTFVGCAVFSGVTQSMVDGQAVTSQTFEDPDEYDLVFAIENHQLLLASMSTARKVASCPQ